jgi:hypothetical protein
MTWATQVLHFENAASVATENCLNEEVHPTQV